MAESAAALSYYNGVRFGRLTAIQHSRTRRAGRAIKQWVFRCDCGSVRTFAMHRVRSGEITSCGCQESEEIDRELSIVDLDSYRKQHGKFRVLPLAVRVDLIRTQYKNGGIYNHAVTPFDLWLSDPDTPFEQRHVRVIEDARERWREIDRPRNEWKVSEDGLDGPASERAKNLLRRCKRVVPRLDWEVFENVIRWNEPYGIPGSRLMSCAHHKEAAALKTVLRVANELAGWQII
ncbi:MAG: hypothetical protein JWR80_9514 [Bradyrhizobium sp.]|nr:hypothetical protein [Bradyrhizobium sp.]